MPIYEYHCSNCHKRADRFRPVESRDAPVECEACGRPMHLVGAPEPSVKSRKMPDVFRKV